MFKFAPFSITFLSHIEVSCGSCPDDIRPRSHYLKLSTSQNVYCTPFKNANMRRANTSENISAEFGLECAPWKYLIVSNQLKINLVSTCLMQTWIHMLVKMLVCVCVFLSSIPVTELEIVCTISLTIQRLLFRIQFAFWCKILSFQTLSTRAKNHKDIVFNSHRPVVIAQHFDVKLKCVIHSYALYYGFLR